MAEDQQQETSYVVMAGQAQAADEAETWERIGGTWLGRTPEKAIEKAVTSVVEEGGTPAAEYVAIPSRNFTVKRPTAKKVVSVAFGD